MTRTKFYSRKYLYSFVGFLFLLFVLYSFQSIYFSNPLLRSFDSFLLSLTDQVTTGTFNLVSFIVKIKLSFLLFSLSSQAAGKAQ